jgi:hypothetical protein
MAAIFRLERHTVQALDVDHFVLVPNSFDNNAHCLPRLIA